MSLNVIAAAAKHKVQPIKDSTSSISVTVSSVFHDEAVRSDHFDSRLTDLT